MKYNKIKNILTVICAIACFQAVAQTPPSAVTAFVQEATGDGCYNTSDCAAGILCFDVGIEVDQPGWDLDAYDIWMDYGPTNAILTYSSDSSCNHSDGGDITALDPFGKYRFLAGQFQLPMPANTQVILHNFCLEIVDFEALGGHTITAGGFHFGLQSNYSLVIPGTQTGVSGFILPSDLVLDATTLSCLEITPMAGFTCAPAPPEIMLMCNPVDATGPGVMDCEAFSYSWSGPGGYTSTLQNPVRPVISGTNAEAGDYTVTVTGANGSCEGIQTFNVNVTNCSALPVEYLSFNAEKRDSEVNLTWETATEINNARFEVERSVDGKEFRSIGDVAGNGTTFATSRYNFIDKAPLEANYYRLRQIDYDGTADYSIIRFVGYDNKVEESEKVVFPNPFRDELTFDLGAPGLYQVELYNTAGELIQKLNITNNASINMSDFAPGVYMFKAYSAEGKEVLVDTVVKLSRS